MYIFTILALGTFKENENSTQQIYIYICAHAYSGLFKIVKIWNLCMCPLIDEQLKKICYINNGLLSSEKEG